MTHKTDAEAMIPAHVVNAYLVAFPHLRHVAARLPGLRAVRQFAQNASRLAAPAGVSAREVYNLMALADR